MRRGQFFIAALAAIITFASLQAFVGHRYYRPYAWHRWHHWNYWGGPYERYGPGWGPDSGYYRYRHSWNDELRHNAPRNNPADSIEQQ